MLVNDYRFTLYNICYKRILMLWITIAFVVLLALLFSGITGILLFSLGVAWLFLNAMAIFLCMWLKLQLARGLEKCLARVNKLLLRHKIIIALDDRGNISCHKVHLCFIYFDAAQCIRYIQHVCMIVFFTEKFFSSFPVSSTTSLRGGKLTVRQLNRAGNLV